jgi:hypothetical protein
LLMHSAVNKATKCLSDNPNDANFGDPIHLQVNNIEILCMVVHNLPSHLYFHRKS